ncbi:sodium-dependent phosphate transport protein 1, chloroplastic [Cryptomeria japonica]|uniref:sodium-dependent phosphate transport protein 1, chloroplastic n=1 Tax=Cryptomeria japonica TaxID=3369 RepID=UPI0025ACC0BE|nr:sodium-dependent phosphate transport protein 1, chloroplastic [Cryptomeria japonica]XP_057851234.1 sodium-dependent phosphate transport protein 1, chloroplastic [Cryptomeria japonica]XP_057851235.1 sodium-dependent phosphate transport protein 1, chloroplastic [Cryptomeria japonica]XP_057851237.1 sodium-dependent phosphate transport protein 1, chloroplastic [Cryptomeria japonica]
MGATTFLSHGPLACISRPGYQLECAAQIQWKECNQSDRCILLSGSSSFSRSLRRRFCIRVIGAKDCKTECCLATCSYHFMGSSFPGTTKLNSCHGGSSKTVIRYSRSIQSMREDIGKNDIFIPDNSCRINCTKFGNLRKIDASCNVKSQHSEGVEIIDLKFGSQKDSGNDIAEDCTQVPKLTSESVNFNKTLISVISENDIEGSSWWEEFPKRWVIVVLCFFAFLLCNMDRVNMSIAILPMSAEFGWSPTTVGLIQSSFFWGYLLTQIAGGIWADKVGGKLVLGFGVIWWSIATMLTPIAAKIGLPALLFVRVCMGIGEGVAMPSMSNLLSRWVPVEERSRSLALVYSGMYLGSVTGLAFSPTLIHNFGWPSVFFSFGSLGAVWFATWQKNGYSSPLEDPHLRVEEKNLILGNSKEKERVESIPWRLLLSKPPVWALITSHFCHNWGTFILLTWMPTYYNQVLKFNLTESGLFCVLPWFTMALSSNLGGWIADTLVSRGTSITVVRKVMQSIGFLGPAFFLTQLSHVNSPAMAVLCMTCSQGCDAFSQSGLYSNHQDIGPRYAGVLLGLSNTAGVLAGVLGTAATGYILQNGSWDDVFKVAVGLYLLGTVIWNTFSTGEQIFD